MSTTWLNPVDLIIRFDDLIKALILLIDRRERRTRPDERREWMSCMRYNNKALASYFKSMQEEASRHASQEFWARSPAWHGTSAAR
jgi:hypothetical protein